MDRFRHLGPKDRDGDLDHLTMEHYNHADLGERIVRALFGTDMDAIQIALEVRYPIGRENGEVADRFFFETLGFLERTGVIKWRPFVYRGKVVEEDEEFPYTTRVYSLRTVVDSVKDYFRGEASQ